ncbi:ion transporter [Clostridium tagluense]|uniref:ion transporter n=1 Tax=Clostridium tagluense TaxID=360422 RepID=UPI001CF158DD|nr:ion transporter [Clostridium tagluense]MCB2297824.1 potassium channel family protein [Clostridium tagluense]
MKNIMLQSIKTKKKYLIPYEITMALLSIIVVLMLLVECTTKLNTLEINVFYILDEVILLVFTADYFIRLYLADNKKLFFKKNIIDLIAIIPFNSIFQAAKVFRIVRISKLLKIIKITKLLRTVIFIKKFKNKSSTFLKTNNFQYILWITIITIGFGAIGMNLAEGKPILDSLWWSFVTITTVGYGDISPTTGPGRIIASILMLVGIGFIGMLTGTISTFFIGKKVEATTFKDETIEMIKYKLDDFNNLTYDEVEDICTVLRSFKNKH